MVLNVKISFLLWIIFKVSFNLAIKLETSELSAYTLDTFCVSREGLLRLCASCARFHSWSTQKLLSQSFASRFRLRRHQRLMHSRITTGPRRLNIDRWTKQRLTFTRKFKASEGIESEHAGTATIRRNTKALRFSWEHKRQIRWHIQM